MEELGSWVGDEEVTGASYSQSAMHELKRDNLIIGAYLNITDLLVSLANVKYRINFILNC